MVRGRLARRSAAEPGMAAIPTAALLARQHAELYCVEPTGMGLRYHGMAIGKGARSAKTDLEKYKVMDMTCEEALGYVAKMCVTRLNGEAQLGACHVGAPPAIPPFAASTACTTTRRTSPWRWS